MTRLPQIERELVAAAARLHGPRRQRTRRQLVGPVLVAGLAVLAALAVLTLVPSGSDEREAARPTEPTGVPPATIQLSRELAQAPAALPSGRLERTDQRANRIASSERSATAAEIQRSTPYPPDRADRFEWETAPVNFRNDLQALVEFRAACLWMQYWLEEHSTGGASAAHGALSVLEDIPSWPTFRPPVSDFGEDFRALAMAARSGDPDPISREVQTNCAPVGR